MYKRITAPSHWASAIVNSDYSGLDEQDKKDLNNFLASEGLSFSDCINWKHVGFVRYHDAMKFTGSADCYEYTFKGE